MKRFKFWTRQEVNLTFGLTQIHDEFELLNNWLATEYAITEEEDNIINTLAKKLKLRVNDWNEEELKMWFISPLLRVIDYEVNSFTPFVDRALSLKLNDETISGKVDLFVARGYEQPLQPYFFLQEYKPERKGNNDPISQLLIAMVAAQYANHEKFPLYGCYVIGQNWYFIVLDDKTYAITSSVSATSYKNLRNIVNALFFVKEQLKKVP